MKTPPTGWQTFLKLCQNMESPEKLDTLFTLFFTPEEKNQLATRVELIRALLLQQETQREISKSLHISIAKITRGSNALKTINASLIDFLKRHLLG